MRTRRRLLSSMLVTVLLVACRSEPSSSPADTMGVAPLPGVTGELVLTRQRDLLDRGLINARVHNESAESLLLSNIELDADTFETEPAADRVISVRSGRRVAIQVPYGEVDDCGVEEAVTARLRFSFTTGDDSPPRIGVIDLAGTDLLDTIRAEQCVSRHLDDTTVTSFVEPTIVDGRLRVDLVIEPMGDASDLSISGVAGTILVSVRARDGWIGDEIDHTVTIPLEFVVNRCDPHALAEVTKRYGLDLAVAVDGADPVDVSIDVDPLVPSLEVIVERCRDSAVTD